MKKLFLIILILMAGFYFFTTPAFAQTAPKTAEFSAALKSPNQEADTRVEILTLFLQKQNSPLVPYVKEFISAADTFNLDWRLVPAITGVESSFGKRIPYNSHNAYGWNNGNFRFNSWEESIDHVSKILKTKYVDRGATNVWSIGRIYAASPTWANRVNHFMAKIEATPNFVLDL